MQLGHVQDAAVARALARLERLPLRLDFLGVVVLIWRGPVLCDAETVLRAVIVVVDAHERRQPVVIAHAGRDVLQGLSELVFAGLVVGQSAQCPKVHDIGGGALGQRRLPIFFDARPVPDLLVAPVPIVLDLLFGGGLKVFALGGPQFATGPLVRLVGIRMQPIRHDLPGDAADLYLCGVSVLRTLDGILNFKRRGHIQEQGRLGGLTDALQRLGEAADAFFDDLLGQIGVVHVDVDDHDVRLQNADAALVVEEFFDIVEADAQVLPAADGRAFSAARDRDRVIAQIADACGQIKDVGRALVFFLHVSPLFGCHHGGTCR